MDDFVGIPEDLRCKRSDGKQWRCSALSMPDKTVCEKHYIQAKRRAATSAQRAMERKNRRKSIDEPDAYLETRNNDHETSRSMSPLNVGSGGGGGGELSSPLASVNKYKEKVLKGQALFSPEKMAPRGFTSHAGLGKRTEELRRDGLQVEENRFRSSFNTPLLGKETKNLNGRCLGDFSGKSSGSSTEAEGLTCHQCQRNDRGNMVWCSSCDRRGYCRNCISRWYADISLEDIRKVCPACRGICNCRACLQGDNIVKAKVQEIAALDKLRYLHSLLKFVLPMLKQIYSEQLFELGVETRALGPKADIPRAKIDADEQMFCDFCRVPIFDYHRHCTKCSYDLCLNCCRDLRRSSSVVVRGETIEDWASERSKEVRVSTSLPEKNARDECAIDFSYLWPKWKASTDGTIPCGPVEAGGCGSSKLVLRRIFKINWVAKLVKCAEEMVNGCIVRDQDTSSRCVSCTGSIASDLSALNGLTLGQSVNNLLYIPDSQDLKHEGISHFHKHWVKGEPVIVRRTFECPLASTWEPLSIWKGIQETMDEKIDENIIVKALDCLKQSQVDIELTKFIKGYSEGCKHGDSQPAMLKLKDWPQPSVLEEFLLCQRPEFLVNFPLIEFVHSKWGILNLAAKLPHDALQNEVGPKLLISYGTHTKPDQGDSVDYLQINMSDQVYLLMHTADITRSLKRPELEKNEKTFKDFDLKRSYGNSYLTHANMNLDKHKQPLEPPSKGRSRENEVASGLKLTEEPVKSLVCNSHEIDQAGMRDSRSSYSDKHVPDYSEKAHAGALWHVFRRQDVSKLNEFLSAHWKELAPTTQQSTLVKHPIYTQAIYLDKDHLKILKEKLGIQPWLFEQHVGEAVFVPAGCPFQVRNLQSSVQLALDFLSPESLAESARMAQEIRCLPKDHEAKLKMLEVGKMSLYAASSAIRETQQITLEPKLSSEIKFENLNLTTMVSENIERLTKRRQVVCS